MHVCVYIYIYIYIHIYVNSTLFRNIRVPSLQLCALLGLDDEDAADRRGVDVVNQGLRV